MLQQAEEDDIIDELDDLDDLDNLDELDNIEKDKDKNEEEILENIVEQEETYIIPRLNIAIKEYDKGNLENNNILSSGSLAKTGEATTILSSLLGVLLLILTFGLYRRNRI